MKMLFDENLPPRIVEAMRDQHPGSAHVRDAGLSATDDELVWEYARRNGYVIVSKDSDFHQRSFIRGHPPKVVWLRVGNSTTQRVIEVLRQHHSTLRRFEADIEAAFLIL